MTTIEILGWKENFTGFTAWDAHAKSELKKRLRRGLKASPAEIRRLARQINDRQVVVLREVYYEAVHGVVQMLETTGATLQINLDRSDTTRLLKKCPDRRGS